MREEGTFVNRAWVTPEVCPGASWAPELSSDLHRAIERIEEALEGRSIGRVVHALVAVRAALNARLTDRSHSASPEGRSLGSGQRRLRRRYAASLYAVERLLEKGWASCDLDVLGPELREELGRLRRLESLENQASFDPYWTDIGVGD